MAQHEWTERRFNQRTVDKIEQRRRKQDFPYWGVIVPEQYLPGFCIKVSKRYSSWIVRHNRRVYPLGKVGIVDLDEARAKAKQTLSQVAGMDDGELAMMKAYQTTTLKELADRHLIWTDVNGEGELAPRTHAKYVQQWDRIVALRMPMDPDTKAPLRPFGAFRLCQVKKGHIRLLRKELVEAPFSFNRIRRQISAAWNLASAEWDLCPLGSNPCVDVKGYPEEKRRIDLSDNQLEDCLLVADEMVAQGKIHWSIANIWWTMYYTGWRPSQTRTIDLSLVDWEKATVTFPQTKTAEWVTEHLPRELHDRLRRAGEGPLFPGKDDVERPITQQAIDRAWYRVRTRAGHPTLIQYAFRHGARTNSVDAGLAPEEAADVMGHSTVTMGETYRQTPQSTRHKAAAKLAQHQAGRIQDARRSRLRLVGGTDVDADAD